MVLFISGGVIMVGKLDINSNIYAGKPHYVVLISKTISDTH